MSIQTQQVAAAMPSFYKQRIRKVLCYANASAAIGAGHVMRLLALAQACKVNEKLDCDIRFIFTRCSDPLQERIKKEGFDLSHLAENFTSDDLICFSPDIIFVDDYSISSSQQKAFEDTKALLIELDDNTHPDKPLFGDIIVNAAANADEQSYAKRSKKATLCLGPAFTLLRQEFMNNQHTALEQRQQILLSLGASDVKNMLFVLTQKLMQYFSDSSGLKICVLVGGLNSQSLAQLYALSTKHSHLMIIPQSDKVSSLMMDAGMAITAAGGTLNELASLGTPAIALVSVDNQQAVLQTTSNQRWYEALDIRDFPMLQVGCADDQIEAEKADKILNQICRQSYELWNDLCKRKAMSDIARQKIDGLGCQRVIQTILAELDKH